VFQAAPERGRRAGADRCIWSRLARAG